MPLNPFSAGILHPISGDDTVISALAFDKAGTAYYTNGGGGGYGNFGIVDLSTFTTKRYFTNLPASHGIIYDPLTGDLIIVGSSHVTQIDPTTMKVVSDREFSSMGIWSLDQGSVDGKGHLYVADNGGRLLFVDYSKTGLIGDPSNFVATPFVANYFDDVAPLAGLGSLGTFVQIQHLLPPSGFSVDSSTLNPAPTSTSATEIDWQTSLPSRQHDAPDVHRRRPGCQHGPRRNADDQPGNECHCLHAGGRWYTCEDDDSPPVADGRRRTYHQHHTAGSVGRPGGRKRPTRFSSQTRIPRPKPSHSRPRAWTVSRPRSRPR